MRIIRVHANSGSVFSKYKECIFILDKNVKTFYVSSLDNVHSKFFELDVFPTGRNIDLNQPWFYTDKWGIYFIRSDGNLNYAA